MGVTVMEAVSWFYKAETVKTSNKKENYGSNFVGNSGNSSG